VRWELTYLGTQVAVATASSDAYTILDEYQLTSWQSGGCAILAAALERLLGAQPYALVRKDGVVDHVVSRHDLAYIDADGAFTAAGIVAKHEELEGHAVRLVRVDKLPAGESSASDESICPASAVAALSDLLQERGVE
jgi:hypothetical protein